MAGLFKKIFGTLNDEGVKYLVAGGLAVNLYGVVRTTADIDIIVKLSNENILKLVKALKKLGYKPRIPVSFEDFGDPDKRQKWIEEKNMMVFSLYNPPRTLATIDIFVKEPFDFDSAYSHRLIKKVDDVEIPLVSLDDLIFLKKKAARTQDLSDIEGLELIKKIEQGKNESNR